MEGEAGRACLGPGRSSPGRRLSLRVAAGGSGSGDHVRQADGYGARGLVSSSRSCLCMRRHLSISFCRAASPKDRMSAVSSYSIS